MYVIITGTAIYFEVGLSTKNSDQFWYFLAINVILAWYAVGVGIFLGVVARSVEVGVQLLPIIAIVQMLFCGFMINFDDIADWLAFLEYPSMFKYAFAALVKNEMSTFDENDCDYGCDINDLNF